MEAVYSSETFISTHNSTHYYKPEAHNLHQYYFKSASKLLLLLASFYSEFFTDYYCHISQ